MDSELLAEAIDLLLGERDLYNIHSMTLVRHGHLVADVYFYPYQPGDRHRLSSTGKVFTSAVVGLAIDQGYIAGVNERVIDFFPDRTIANLSQWKRAMTIEHLLTMTSGLGGVLPYEDEADELDESSDPVQYALDLPMTSQPGTVWRYSNPNAFLLSAIITQATGRSALDFAAEHMFGPLGIIEPLWDQQVPGITDGTGGVMLTPHDLAKFGQLFLQEGEWEGNQILSRAWVTTSTTPHHENGYCYIWDWNADLGFFCGGGSGGQRLVVVPALDLVAAFTGGGYAHEDIERIYLEALSSYVFPAVESEGALPPNPAGTALLAGAVSRAAASDQQPHPVDPLPAMASQVSGRTYAMDPPIGAMNVVLSFPTNDEARLAIAATPDIVEGSPFELAAGLDGVYRFARGTHGMLAAGTGGWQDEATFVMEVDLLGNQKPFRFTLAFEGDGVVMTVEDLDYWRPDPPLVFTGTAAN
jgi:CubicO group peptidase (beta-lactamase class C family)